MTPIYYLFFLPFGNQQIHIKVKQPLDIIRHTTVFNDSA